MSTTDVLSRSLPIRGRNRLYPSRLAARLVAIASCAGLVSTAVPVVVRGQANVTIAISDSTQWHLAPGAKVAIPLLVLPIGGANIAALQGTITWGTSRLTFDSVKTGPFGSLTPNVTGAASGSVILNSFRIDGKTTRDTVAMMYFTASATPGGTRMIVTPTVAGNEVGSNILSSILTKNLDVCVALAGKWGDVNDDGNVNIIDAQQVARNSVGLSVANAAAMAARGDVTADGSTNIIDAQQIARFSVGLSAAARTGTALFTAPAVASVAVTPSAAQTLIVGQTLQLSADPKDATTASLAGCAAVTWTSSDTTKARISASGLVTAVAVGSATITATSGGQTANVSVTTVGAAATLTKLAGDAQSATVSTAVATAPSVKLTDANGNAVASATVTFVVASGGGSVTGASQTTSSSGVATVGSWTLGSAAGANTLTASSTGVTSATFTATGTAAATTTTVTFCNPTNSADLPIWFAYQNGTSGAWTQLTANADKSYTVPITSVGGISYVVQQGTSYEHDVLYASKTELAGLGCIGSATGTKTINGSVSGLMTDSVVSIISFGSTFAVAGWNSTSFSLTQAADGARDLFAVRGYPNSVDRYIVRRALNPASGSTLPVLVFDSSEALAPSTATYTLGGIGTDSWLAGTLVITANLTIAGFGETTGTGTGADIATTYRSLPASLRLSSDNYQFYASASATNSDRDVIQNLTTFGNRSVTLGPALSVPTVTTAATSPNVRMRMQLASQTAYAAYVSAHYFGPGPSNNHDVEVSATAGYFGGTPATWDLTIPDLSSAGFQAAWGLPTGGAVGWNVLALSSLALFDKTTETPTLFAQRFDDSAFGVQLAGGSAAAVAQRRQLMTRFPFRKK